MNNNNFNCSSNKLYIGRLPPNTNVDDVKDVLSNAGIAPVKLVLKRNYALVDLPENVTAEAAIPLLNGMYSLFQFCRSIILDFSATTATVLQLVDAISVSVLKF